MVDNAEWLGILVNVLNNYRVLDARLEEPPEILCLTLEKDNVFGSVRFKAAESMGALRIDVAIDFPLNS